jgi:hypothetical protein
MSTFYHELTQLDFQHQVVNVSGELEFRMRELIEASREDIERFRKSMLFGTPVPEPKPNPFPFRFGSVLALLQTFRDTLIRALDLKKKDIPGLEDGVQHVELFRKLRNLVVHDGYQPLGMWAYGRFYLPVSIKRNNHFGETVLIEAPVEDMETLCLEYARSFSLKLANRLANLPADKKLNGHQFRPEWIIAASSHPAVKDEPLLKDVPSPSDWPAYTSPPPLDKAAAKLRDIADLCLARLNELELLPPAA